LKPEDFESYVWNLDFESYVWNLKEMAIKRFRTETDFQFAREETSSARVFETRTALS
jgi:hypothetical protein